MQMQRVVSTEHVLLAELRRSEKLIWSGRPRQGVFLTQRDAGMIPFSLMWGGFSFFWEFKAVSSGGPLFFALWGVPFVLVGLYMIVGRFFYEAMLRSRTYYGLTNERVIIISGLSSRTVKSLQVQTLTDVSLSEEASGTGTITFGPNMSYSGRRSNAGRNPQPSFESIEDAREVFERICSARRGA
ncbi:MAG: hypothetical protein ACJ8R9_09680 [Steroidobacteraceae bacterium]